MARLRAGRARPSASQAARLQIKSRHYGKLCANPRRMGSAREKRKRISTPVGAFHCSIVNDSVNETAELIRSRSKTSRNRRNNPVVFLTQNSRDGIIQFFPPSVRNSWSDGTFYYKKKHFFWKAIFQLYRVLLVFFRQIFNRVFLTSSVRPSITTRVAAILFILAPFFSIPRSAKP